MELCRSFAKPSSLPGYGEQRLLLIPLRATLSLTLCCSATTSKTTTSTAKPLISSEPSPKLEAAEAFAPATVANLGPGFDFLGCAVDGLGDRVTAKLSDQTPPGKVSISRITGDGSRLSLNADQNCAGIAAEATMELLGVRSVGISLELNKGLPLGSGLGSSAASAAAAAVAVNALFGSPLSKQDLVLAGLKSEAAVSGYHADNVAPSLLGGFVLVNSYDPLQLIELALPPQTELYFVLVGPDFEAPTKQMRAVLPTQITMKDHIFNSSRAASLVAALMSGDLPLLGKSMSMDTLVEPTRAPLIPGMRNVKEAALLAGAFGCTISGAGPTAVAITNSYDRGLLIGEKMVASFMNHGKLRSTAHVQRLDRVGARTI